MASSNLCASYELQSHSEIEPTEERPRIKRKISLFFHQENFCKEATFIWPRSTSKPLEFKDDPQVQHYCTSLYCKDRDRKKLISKPSQTRLHGHYWLSPLRKSTRGWLASCWKARTRPHRTWKLAKIFLDQHWTLTRRTHFRTSMARRQSISNHLDRTNYDKNVQEAKINVFLMS